MTVMQEREAATKAGYQLQGSLLEACSCGILCPCWVGENPDLGECFAVNAYHFDKGHIGGVDVSGLSLVNVVHIPGNVLTPGSWKVAMLVDSNASEEQREAILGAYRGKFGGPLADLAGLIGEVVGVESVPITHEVVGGKGTLHVEGMIDTHMEPYRAADGTITTLRDSVFSTVPGSPAYVAKQSRYSVNLPQYGMVWEYKNTNAIQADYMIDFAG